MTYNGPYLSANQFLGLAKETVKGTAVQPGIWLPAGSPEWTPDISWLDDDAFRGSPDKIYQELAGVRYDKFSIKTYVYPDTFPNMALAVLGNADVVGTTNPYLHTIGLYNSAANGSQPPGYTLSWMDADQQLQMAAGQADALNIMFSSEGKSGVDVTSTWISNPAVNYTSTTWSSSFSTQYMVPSWDVAVTLGTASQSVYCSGALDIKRNTKPVFTLGTQAPYSLFADAIDVTGKMTAVLQHNDPNLTNALTQGTFALTLQFTDPATGYYAKFVMSTVQFKNPKITTRKSWVELDTEFTAVGNTTDAVSGGWSPIKFTASNAQSSAY